VHSTFVVETTIGVSRIDWLKVFVVPLFPPTLLVFDEEINMVQFPWLDNVIVFVIKSPHEWVVVVLLILIAF
jgi:hypothetical protein